MTFEAGKTYETKGLDQPALVAHVFPDGRLMCVQGNCYWICDSDGVTRGFDSACNLLAPKPEPRRVLIMTGGHSVGSALEWTNLECLIGPDGALRVV